MTDADHMATLLGTTQAQRPQAPVQGQVVEAVPVNQVPAPYTPPLRGRLVRTIAAETSGLAMVITGAIMFNKTATGGGVVLALFGLVAMVVPAIIGIGRFLRNERRELLRKMTPEQQKAYKVAETAAMFAGAAAFHEYVKHSGERTNAKIAERNQEHRERFERMYGPQSPFGQRQQAAQEAATAPQDSMTRPHHPWDDPADWAR